MRVRVGAVVAVIGAAVLASGCTGRAAGVPQRAPYRALPVDSVTAAMAAPVQDAIAYSPDGTRAVTRTETGICIKRAVNRTAAVGAGPVCADLGTVIGQVAFSPDGATVAALENMTQTFRGRLWLISTQDGRATETPPLGDPGAGAPPSGASAPAESSEGSSIETGSPYISVAWTGNGTLLALVADVADGGTHLAEVDPASGRADDLGRVTPGDAYATGTLLSAGRTALMPVASSQRGRPRLAVVDLRSRSTRTVTLTGGMITANSQALPLAIAPDGRSAVLWVVDPVTYAQSPPAHVDLDTGAVTVIGGSGGLLPSGAAYSPDGSQLMMIVRKERGDRSLLVVMPATGGTPRTVSELAGAVTPGIGLDWTPTDLVVPYLPSGVASLSGLAPVQLTG